MTGAGGPEPPRRSWSGLRSRGGCGVRRDAFQIGSGAVLEAEAVVSGFENVAAVGETKRGRHLRVAEHGCPLAKAEIGRDDDAGALVEFAQQMEEQCSAGGAERQVTQLVEDDEIGAGKPGGDLSWFALKLLLFESVDEFDGGEEADALAMVLDRLAPIAVAR